AVRYHAGSREHKTPWRAGGGPGERATRSSATAASALAAILACSARASISVAVRVASARPREVGRLPVGDHSCGGVATAGIDLDGELLIGRNNAEAAHAGDCKSLAFPYQISTAPENRSCGHRFA